MRAALLLLVSALAFPPAAAQEAQAPPAPQAAPATPEALALAGWDEETGIWFPPDAPRQVERVGAKSPRTLVELLAEDTLAHPVDWPIRLDSIRHLEPIGATRARSLADDLLRVPASISPLAARRGMVRDHRGARPQGGGRDRRARLRARAPGPRGLEQLDATSARVGSVIFVFRDFR